jgi:hypothetical protein
MIYINGLKKIVNFTAQYKIEIKYFYKIKQQYNIVVLIFNFKLSKYYNFYQNHLN